MKADYSFSGILNAAAKGWCERKSDEGVLSIALPLQNIDPLLQLPLIAKEQAFRFLWDETPGISIAAAGQCQQLELVGPRRFELAQKFSDTILGRLTDLAPETPPHARARVLLAFSFFESPPEQKRQAVIPAGVQAVLPRWQISNQEGIAWLRLNGVAIHQADARELAEQLWLMNEKLSKPLLKEKLHWENRVADSSTHQQWQNYYQPALSRGLELINGGELKKLVLAVRQSIQLEAPLNHLELLYRLRMQQAGSCRFLWQRANDEAFFGASPERLISLRKSQLLSDALAGTASRNDNGKELIKSEKDLREHQLVVNSIIKQLVNQGLKPSHPIKPKLTRHGQLVHLHTPITANAKGYSTLQIAEHLHPTPAVAGLPKREAMSWLRTLEPFERGQYASPIGWIDSHGDSELRVAIRCGRASKKTLELTAGAGLVRGSIPERELEEVGLKLAVLADQLNLIGKYQSNPLSNRSIT